MARNECAGYPKRYAYSMTEKEGSENLLQKLQ